MQNDFDSIGFLEVTVGTANGALPIENAGVTIYEYAQGESGNNGRLLYSLVTDNEGKTPRVVLSTKKREQSLSPGIDETPYSVYNIGVTKEGYYNNTYLNVPIFQGITSLQQVNMIPLLEYASPYDDYPISDGRDAITPNTKL